MTRNNSSIKSNESSIKADSTKKVDESELKSSSCYNNISVNSTIRPANNAAVTDPMVNKSSETTAQVAKVASQLTSQPLIPLAHANQALGGVSAQQVVNSNATISAAAIQSTSAAAIVASAVMDNIRSITDEIKKTINDYNTAISSLGSSNSSANTLDNISASFKSLLSDLLTDFSKSLTSTVETKADDAVQDSSDPTDSTVTPPDNHEGSNSTDDSSGGTEQPPASTPADPAPIVPPVTNPPASEEEEDTTPIFNPPSQDNNSTETPVSNPPTSVNDAQAAVDQEVLAQYLQKEEIRYSENGNPAFLGNSDLLSKLGIIEFYKTVDNSGNGEDTINDPGNEVWKIMDDWTNQGIVIKLNIPASEIASLKLVDYQLYNSGAEKIDINYQVVQYQGANYLYIPNEKTAGLSNLLGSAESAFLKFQYGTGDSAKAIGVEVVGIAALCEGSVFRVPDKATVNTDGIQHVYLTSNDAVTSGVSTIAVVTNFKVYDINGALLKDFGSAIPAFAKISADGLSLDIDPTKGEMPGWINQKEIVTIKFNYADDLLSHDTRTTGQIDVVKTEVYNQMIKEVIHGSASEDGVLSDEVNTAAFHLSSDSNPVVGISHDNSVAEHVVDTFSYDHVDIPQYEPYIIM